MPYVLTEQGIMMLSGLLKSDIAVKVNIQIIDDAYSLLVDILKEAENEIIMIDNYIDKSILDLTCLIDKKITIITNKYNNSEIGKYKSQYDNLKIIVSNLFHDRFIIIDKKVLYHCGSSFKDLGKKCFAINKIEDDNILNDLIGKINNIKQE